MIYHVAFEIKQHQNINQPGLQILCSSLYSIGSQGDTF